METVCTVRDKWRVREFLLREGLSPSASVPVEPSADDISRAADAVGFPLVLKDSAGTASRSVWVIRDEQEVRWAASEARSAPLRGHLIAERYFTGPLYSAETLTWEGHTRLLGITGRILSPEPLRRENAAAFPVAFHQQGFAHVELALTSEGPQLVEVNSRIAGAVIGEAMCRSLGTNVYAASISMALGERPALLDSDLTLGRGQGMIYLHPSQPGTLVGWSGLDRLPGFPGRPEWLPAASPGDRIEHLADQRGCTGFILAYGPTAELALYNALTAADTVTHDMEEAPA
jgi:biotin carboxylase